MSDDATYVSRGGLKLRHALREFAVDPRDAVCADLGCSTGGFTDCLLQHGASKVFAVDTAYGELAWKLRKDPRVEVMERTNAVHAAAAAPVDLVVVDLGWTPQHALLPAALRWLKPAEQSHAIDAADADVKSPTPAPQTRPPRIITLIKPHYEARHSSLAREAEASRGILHDDLAERVMRETVARMEAAGVRVPGVTRSPLRGGSKGDGNLEWLALVERAE
jgi:23S rRNA (cytidine1920-2'-O)/16S rRNA (cytidine1409-2'-O)-methyltransferase